MDYKELFNRYKIGLATEEEIDIVEKELEKYEIIQDYLSDMLSEEFDEIDRFEKIESSSEEVFSLRKSVNNKLRNVVFASVCIVFFIVMSILYIVSPIMNEIYYNPSKFEQAKGDNDVSIDIWAISELNNPGISPSTVMVKKEGFGKYELIYSYTNTFTGQGYGINEEIYKGENIYSYNDHFRNNNDFESIKYGDENQSNLTDQNIKIINHIKKLNSLTYISMGIMFAEDLSMEELYDLQEKYPKVEFQWAAIRTGEDNTSQRDMIGINLIGSKSHSAANLVDISRSYPGFYIWDWLVNPIGKVSNIKLEAQAYTQHYISLLEYLVDREEAVKALEHGDYKYEFYKSALEYARKEEIKSYAVLVFAEASSLIEMLEVESIKALEFNDALVSKTDIR